MGTVTIHGTRKGIDAYVKLCREFNQQQIDGLIENLLPAFGGDRTKAKAAVDKFLAAKRAKASRAPLNFEISDG